MNFGIYQGWMINLGMSGKTSKGNNNVAWKSLRVIRNSRPDPDFPYALTRSFSDKNQQRIVVIGDGDFLSNAYLGNVGNSELGFRLINWLTHDDQFIEIPAKITPGKSLQLTTTSIAIIGFGFLIILPLLLIVTGFVIWRRRKRR